MTLPLSQPVLTTTIDSETDGNGGVGDKRVVGAAAFSKFVTVLQLIADAEEPTNVARLGVLSGYPRPTVHRIVAALLAEGMVVPGLIANTFKLGPRLINLASRSWERSDLRLAGIDALTKLRDITGETIHIAVPSELGMIYIEKLESPHAVRMASRIGTRVSMVSSSVGKAYLASLDKARQNALIKQVKFQRHTIHTIMDADTLRKELELTRERGYALDQQENELSIFCYGAAIPSNDGQTVGCVSISMPTFRHDPSDPARYIKPLIEACQSIARQLGPIKG